MKKRIAILLSFALMFTSAFGMGVSYAGTTEAEKDFNLRYTISDSSGEYQGRYTYSVDATEFAKAKTEEGLDIVVPEGYISGPGTADYGFVLEAYAYYERSESNIVSLDMNYVEEDTPDEYADYDAIFQLKDKVVNGAFTHVITATLNNNEKVVYNFNFKESEESNFTINYFGLSYYDDSGNNQYEVIANAGAGSEPIDVNTLTNGKTVELPYYYDNDKGFIFEADSYGTLFKTDFASKYTMSGNSNSFNLKFTAVNGQSVIIPITVTCDADGENAEIDSFAVNVYQYYSSDDSYVDKYINFDSFTINQKNEIYLPIPSEYECYYWDDDSFCEWVNIKYITDVTLQAYAKDDARFKVVDGDGWTNMQDYTSVKMDGYGYENCVEDEVVLEVHSPSGKVVKSYTVKVIVSDCDGYHTFSTWQVDKAPTCTEKGLEAHKCKYCPYKEYREVAAKGHTPGAAATCTTAQKCKNCSYQYAPAKGHDIVVDKAVNATCTTSGLTEGKHCTRCDYKVAQQPVAAKGHAPGAAATCTTPQVCTACQTQLAPATGHTATAPVVTKATAKADGSIVTKCGCGEVLSTEVIKAASKISLSKTAYTYTGKKVKAPTVRVKDAAGKTIPASNYTITKPKNVNKMKDIGRYTYTIKFKGDKYSGTQKVSMEIKAKKPTIKAPAASKKAITVKWAKGKKAQVTGYEVTVATNKKFTKNVKSVKVKGYAKVSKKITKLKAKTKYYVKVRSYKTVKGVKIYSDWSKVKTIKTK